MSWGVKLNNNVNDSFNSYTLKKNNVSAEALSPLVSNGTAEKVSTVAIPLAPTFLASPIEKRPEKIFNDKAKNFSIKTKNIRTKIAQVSTGTFIPFKVEWASRQEKISRQCKVLDQLSNLTAEEKHFLQSALSELVGPIGSCPEVDKIDAEMEVKINQLLCAQKWSEVDEDTPEKKDAPKKEDSSKMKRFESEMERFENLKSALENLNQPKNTDSPISKKKKGGPLLQKRSEAVEKQKLELRKKIDQIVIFRNPVEVERITAELKKLSAQKTTILAEKRKEKLQLLNAKDPSELILEKLEKVDQNRFNVIQSDVRKFLKLVRPFQLSTAPPLKNYTRDERYLDSSYSKSSEVKDDNALSEQLAKYSYSDKSDKNEYLYNRLSRTALSLIQEEPEKVEIFIGPLADLVGYYNKAEFEFCCELTSASSADVYLFTKPNDLRIVMTNILSKEAIFHRLLQLKLSNIKVDNIKVRGDLDDYLNGQIESLSKKIVQSERLKKILIIGNSEIAMRNVQQIAGNSNYERRKCKTASSGNFEIVHDVVNINKTKLWVGTMRMPNGSTSGKIVKKLLEDKKVDYIITVGAGGYLPSSSSSRAEDNLTGSCHVVDKVYYNGKIRQFDIKLGRMVPSLEPLENSRGSKFNLTTGNVINETVDSILVEDKDWVANALTSKVNVVDVETYHMINAIATYNFKINSQRPPEDQKPTAKMIPGLFISDVIGKHPLDEKISAGVAYPHMKEFLSRSFRAITQDINK